MRAAVSIGLGVLLPACGLIGYDPLDQAPDARARQGGDAVAPRGDAEPPGAGVTVGLGPGDTTDAAAFVPLRDASSPTFATDAAPAAAASDAAMPPADGAMAVDAAVDAVDAAQAIADAGADDAASMDDPPGCPGSENACGGCEALPDAVGEPCGVCGLGGYVCEGSDATVCQGGDALPQTSGGDVMIDDFEDGDRYVLPNAQLNGSWYTTDDGTGGLLVPVPSTSYQPAEGGVAGSAYAGYMAGGGFTDWGAALAVSLNGYRCAYDATGQQGIRFYARGTGSVTVAIATNDTIPRSEDGNCLLDCYDHYSLSIDLGATWALYQLPWFRFSQSPDWGTDVIFRVSQLRTIEFAAPANSTFQLYVDDLAFY